MNADYPANPATPGAHPFPGVTQAVPQGPGGPEAAPVQWGAVGARMQSQPGAGGGPVQPGAPAVPRPSTYAAPGGSTVSGNPTAPAQPVAPAAPAATPAAVPPAPVQHTPTSQAPASHAPTSHTPSQPSAATPPPAATNPAATTAASPIRRTSLRTGTQAVATGAHPQGTSTDTPAPKKLSLFGKKAEAEVPVTGTTTTTLRRKGGPRKVRAMLISVDPWSAMKMSFLTSIAAGIAFVVAVSMVWGVLNTMGVFAAIQEQITTLFNLSAEKSLLQYFQLSKVMSGAILVAVFNTVLLTALGTISALIYNIIGKLVGGVYVTLSDD